VSRALFISDLHLSAERPDSNRQFFRFLGDEATRAQALYVLGDLFEYWAGDDELREPGGDPLAAEVAAAFKTLAGRGVQVSIMHGNRDFLIAADFCAASAAGLLADPSVVAINGASALLMHGDTLCTDDVDYQIFRRRIRHPMMMGLLRHLPFALRRSMARQARTGSESAKANKPGAIMDVNADAVAHALRTQHARRLIHGHTHCPARHIHAVDGHDCERWVVPDWYTRWGYVVCDAQGCALKVEDL
jgi:UDP-2,3-diacylglucosamine hydrolase